MPLQVDGKIFYKTYRIGYHYVDSVTFDFASGGVQRSKKQIVRINVVSGKRIKQGGFACIGIAHKGDGKNFIARTAFSNGLTLFFQLFEFGIELVYFATNVSFVRFQLRFTGTASSYSSALSRVLFILPVGKPVRELRQFHLLLAFGALGMQSKNVQYQIGFVDDIAIKFLGDVSTLYGVQIVAKSTVSTSLVAQ